jgi:hypothetical protein
VKSWWVKKHRQNGDTMPCGCGHEGVVTPEVVVAGTGLDRRPIKRLTDQARVQGDCLAERLVELVWGLGDQPGRHQPEEVPRWRRGPPRRRVPTADERHSKRDGHSCDNEDYEQSDGARHGYSPCRRSAAIAHVPVNSATTTNTEIADTSLGSLARAVAAPALIGERPPLNDPVSSSARETGG